MDKQRKIFTVYTPNGAIFIKADFVTKGGEKNEIIFYTRRKNEGYVNEMVIPVAQFNLYNIYGWCEGWSENDE